MNLVGAFALCRAAVPLMDAAGRARRQRLVRARQPGARADLRYAASKGGLEMVDAHARGRMGAERDSA